MTVLSDLDSIQLNQTIVTLGKFDGNHIGHQLLFKTAVGLKSPGDQTVIFTFNVPPATVIREEEAENLRTILTHEERILAGYPEGIDHVIEFPFNENTRKMSPEAFVEEILVQKLHVKAVVVGVDFCFGRNRSGNVATLKALGERFGFRVFPVEKVRCLLPGAKEELEVSSTLIKQEIQKGNMENAKLLLGQPFFMIGEVLHGKHLGSKIGFPTINFKVPADKLLPPNGVYATKVHYEGRELCGITNVGNRPTFDDGPERTVETNIFDFSGNLYGQTLRLDFYQFIRPERKFSSAEELAEEIRRNVAQVREVLSC